MLRNFDVAGQDSRLEMSSWAFKLLCKSEGIVCNFDFFPLALIFTYSSDLPYYFHYSNFRLLLSSFALRTPTPTPDGSYSLAF